MQRAIVALHQNPRLADLDDHKIPKIVHESTRLDDIAEETGDDSDKAESSTAANEKTRVEQMHPQTERKGPQIVIEKKGEDSTGFKDDTAISIRSRRSRDTESIIVLRRQSILHR